MWLSKDSADGCPNLSPAESGPVAFSTLLSGLLGPKATRCSPSGLAESSPGEHTAASCPCSGGHKADCCCPRSHTMRCWEHPESSSISNLPESMGKTLGLAVSRPRSIRTSTLKALRRPQAGCCSGLQPLKAKSGSTQSSVCSELCGEPGRLLLCPDLDQVVRDRPGRRHKEVQVPVLL